MSVYVSVLRGLVYVLLRYIHPYMCACSVLYEEDRIEKPAGSLCCQEIMAMRIVNKVIGLRRAEDRLKIGMT